MEGVDSVMVAPFSALADAGSSSAIVWSSTCPRRMAGTRHQLDPSRRTGRTGDRLAPAPGNPLTAAGPGAARRADSGRATRAAGRASGLAEAYCQMVAGRSAGWHDARCAVLL